MNLKRLRERFPNEGWKAVRAGFGWGYENAKGEIAHWVSVFAPCHADDDNTFQSQFYVYRHAPAHPELLTIGATYRG